MTIKPVFRFDEIQKHFRLFRILWTRGVVGDGEGYSAKLSLAIAPRLIGWHKDSRTDWMVYLLGMRFHYCRSYGGIMV